MKSNKNEIFWTVRDYNPEDRESLRHIYLESRKLAFPWLDADTLKLEDFDAAIQEEEVLVALSDHEPIGFIAWWLPDNFIHSLFIHPDFIGHGVGKSLLKACLARTGRPATLKCLQANKNALKFYASQGWEIISDGESPDGDFYLLGIE
ncbi:GNAT family N-acetyltransferase [Dyadobacter sp. CY356]|uniref:GNAT family N-acetyltransferase n=1 Tax=Dyadobacter sp. CY356 TaxID=2906442 RepID=UPI001F47E3C5|nr:GNAT family N-acetyltransferase [Dyadobacter sp. CY356]MCF0054342.1 GNAT family N-acetyltransferase [Dyadobacter sp. CY356]